MSCKQRVTQRTNKGRPAGVNRRLQLINDGAHPLTLCRIGKPLFVQLPPIFVVL